MDKQIEKIRKDLQRIANNCDFYLAEGMIEHYKNEVGCLRGMMYAADIIGCPYPKDIFYDRYIKKEHERMKEEDPSHPVIRNKF